MPLHLSVADARQDSPREGRCSWTVACFKLLPASYLPSNKLPIDSQLAPLLFHVVQRLSEANEIFDNRGPPQLGSDDHKFYDS